MLQRRDGRADDRVFAKASAERRAQVRDAVDVLDRGEAAVLLAPLDERLRRLWRELGDGREQLAERRGVEVDARRGLLLPLCACESNGDARLAADDVLDPRDVDSHLRNP